jgi:hypothetical protein
MGVEIQYMGSSDAAKCLRQDHIGTTVNNTIGLKRTFVRRHGAPYKIVAYFSDFNAQVRNDRALIHWAINHF